MLATLALALAVPATAAGDYSLVTRWGIQGSGNGQFNGPFGLSVDASSNVYVADEGNNRVQKFDANGNFLLAWGTSGSGNGQFSFPEGTAVGPSGNVYVDDGTNARIQVFDQSGAFISAFGSFSEPRGIGIDAASGDVYVADLLNNNVQRFDSNGNLLQTWGSAGSGDGQFNHPSGVAATGGNVYVVDRDNNRIERFNTSGVFTSAWGSSGSGDGQFSTPQGIGVDPAGNVYVADTQNDRVQKFQSDGTFITKFAAPGPSGVAIASNGDAYVAEFGNQSVGLYRNAAAGAGPPVLGKSVDAQAVSGRVLVQVPPSKKFVPLTSAQLLPVGTVFDTRHGRVRITSAADAKGKTQSGDFFEGLFILEQRGAAGATTDLALTGGSFKSCRGRGAAVAAKARQIRHLWADAQGRFRTIGRYAAATVRGTLWLTTDRCDGTLITVRKGSVTVRDFVRRRNVVVRAGHSYLAAAHR